MQQTWYLFLCTETKKEPENGGTRGISCRRGRSGSFFKWVQSSQPRKKSACASSPLLAAARRSPPQPAAARRSPPQPAWRSARSRMRFSVNGGVLYSARRKQRDLTRRRAMRFKYYATKRCLLYVSDLNLTPTQSSGNVVTTAGRSDISAANLCKRHQQNRTKLAKRCDWESFWPRSVLGRKATARGHPVMSGRVPRKQIQRPGQPGSRATTFLCVFWGQFQSTRKAPRQGMINHATHTYNATTPRARGSIGPFLSFYPRFLFTGSECHEWRFCRSGLAQWAWRRKPRSGIGNQKQ